MGAQPSDQIASAGTAPAEDAPKRKLLLGQLAAERERPPLPPPPVLSVDPAAVDAVPIAGGRRGAMKRVAELEALARRNLRAAEEARRVVQEERLLLEEEATARTQAEREAGSLRAELERMRATEEQRAAQARFAAASAARSELETEIERVHGEHSRVVEELDRLRGTLFDHDSLLDEYSQRLHEEQAAQATARAELVRSEEARHSAERNLEIATETARRRAEDDHTRIAKLEEVLQDARVERDRALNELRALTTGDGQLARLREDLESTREDMTRALADLDVQAARADEAERELTTAREEREQADRVATDAVAARDAAVVSLETTRAELLERSEALDRERTTSQATIGELRTALASATRSAESAAERAADLESRLESVTSSRDAALARNEELEARLDRALADAEQLRTHAASIGDELAATQHALDDARRPVVQVVAMPDAGVGVDAVAFDGTDDELPDLYAASAEAAAHSGLAPEAGDDALAGDAPSPFDVAIASAFHEAVATTEPAAGPVDPFGPREPRPAAPKRVRSGGPVIEREAAMVRELVPVPADGADTAEEAPAEPPRPVERSPEVQAFRRTAMAELTALATDSDDLTPRRRR